MCWYRARAWSKGFPYDLKTMPSAFAADPPIRVRNACKGGKDSLSRGLSTTFLQKPSNHSSLPNLFHQEQKDGTKTLEHSEDLISCPRDLITATAIG